MTRAEFNKLLAEAVEQAIADHQAECAHCRMLAEVER